MLLAERGDVLTGFAFAIPDYLQRARGVAVDTLILKTVARKPGRALAGLGGVLVSKANALGRQAGFTTLIHALMHSDNPSFSISRRYAEPFRHYALFAKRLS